MGTQDPHPDLTAAAGARAGGPGALPSGLSRDGLLGEVARVCRPVLPHAATAVVAVSGGPDSTALAYLVVEARPDVTLFVAHVRHGLRDDRADAAVAADHAAALGIGYLERAVEVAPEGRGIEDAARRARYGALAQLARQVGAGVVLVGHTADDQAETVLLNLARGTGIRGVGAMAAAARRADGLAVVRPLLRIRRSDVHAFVAGEGLEAVADPTNADPAQRRARVRGEVLPALARLSGGPGDPVGVLTRLADLARADADALDAIAAAQLERIGRRWGPVWCVPEAELAALPSALASRVVRAVLARVREVGEGVTGGGGNAEGPGADAVASVLALSPGGACHVPGGAWVTKGGGWFAFCPAGTQPLEARALRVPGATPLPEIDAVVCVDHPWGWWTIESGVPVTALGQRRLDLDLFAPPPVSAVTGPQAGAPAPLAALPPGARAAARGWVVLPPDVVQAGASVRGRRPGDRLTLSHGTRKLQDLFTDLRVPRGVRDLVPVVADAQDRPLWVPGVGVRHWPGDTPAGVRCWLAPLDPAALGYPLATGWSGRS